jgi:hypothetical protein
MSTYDVVTRGRQGSDRTHRFNADGTLAPGEVVHVEGRDWLIDRVEGDRAIARPARYRLRLRHPDGHEEVGAMRRFRRDRPRIGHAFTTLHDASPISWQVTTEQLGHDDAGEPFLELVAERDYSEYEQLPDHQLEHALAREGEPAEAATAVFERAEREGLAVELVALEPGEAPDWDEAGRYIDALVEAELAVDLVELCGVSVGRDPRPTWLDTVRRRLSDDLARLRDDVEGEHDQIEEWEFEDGRILASLGREEDESDPESGHGWMCRLHDSGALAAAGFREVRKADVWPEES